MQEVVKVIVWHTDDENKAIPDENDLANAKVHTSVPPELDDAQDVRWDASLRVQAVYSGGDTLGCWLDEIDGDVRWRGEGFSDWGSLSEMFGEYAFEL